MKLNVENINKTISLLNETIINLLEDGIVTTPIDGTGIPVIKQKFTVYEDDDVPVNTETEFFIGITDAKEYKSDVQVGDEIEIEVMDFDSSEDSDITEFLSQDTLTTDDLEQIVLGGGKTVRVGGRVLRYGPKSWRKVKRIVKSIKDYKKYIDRYGKKIEHSLCYCLHFTKEYVDPADGKISRDVYESDLNYIKPIQDEMLNSWDFCEKEFGDSIIEKDDRQDTQKDCLLLDTFWEQQHNLMNDLLNKLGKFFEVRGVNIKKTIKNDVKGDTTVAERIVSKDEMSIKFDSDVIWKDPAAGDVTIYNSGENILFEIEGTYSDNSNSVRLTDKNTNKKYILTFTKSTVTQRQSNNAFWLVKSDGSIDGSKTTWSGKINYYRDN